MKKQKIWETNEYYDQARSASLDVNHPAMKLLSKLAINKKILDLGCGEGTRLEYLTKNTKKKATGIDVSKKAITLARKKDKRNNYIVADSEKLPIKDETFDLVYSAFVLEHTDDTQKFINEAIRVLKKNGDIVFVCPNYGSPNRVSPPNVGSNRIIKLISGFVDDIRIFLFDISDLDWNKVKPLEGKYFSDSDTTVEPYVLSLKKYLQSKEFKIELASSLWSEELKNASFHQKFFRKLADYNIYPFIYWGPHLLIHAKK